MRLNRRGLPLPGQAWKGNLLAFLVLTVILALLPLAVTSKYHQTVLVFIGIHTILTVGLSLVMGYAGQISLGHATFYGLGAYITGILTVRYGLSPWLALLMAAALTGLVAFLMGIPIFRLRGHYLAMATLALNVIFTLIITQQVGWTGGPSGLRGIPKLAVGGFTFSTDLHYYYLTWAVALALLGLSLNIVNSRVGRALRAIHSSEIAAETLGVDTERFKLQVFGLGAIYASLAGSLYGFYLGFISPSTFGLMFSIELVVMAVVGGLASIWGAIFGAGSITVLGELLRDLVPRLLKEASGEHRIIVFGLILMVIMIFMPEGLVRGTLNAWDRLRRSRLLLSPSPPDVGGMAPLAPRGRGDGPPRPPRSGGWGAGAA